MSNSFSNYYLKTDSTDNIIKFCENLQKQIVKLNINEKNIKPICLSFSNLHFMLDTNSISHFVNRFNIRLIPSYRVQTFEGIELYILNPKEKALDLLQDLELDRTTRMLLMLEKLKEELFIVLDYDEINKIKELKYINEFDLSQIVFEHIKTNKNLYKHLKFKTISEVYENIIKILYKLIPLESKFFESVVSMLYGTNSLYIANPEKYIEYLIDDRIDGAIYNQFTSRADNRFMEACKQNNKDLLFGTGEYI